MPGAATAAAPDKLISTTCYLVPWKGGGGGGGGASAADGEWLPLWQWDRSERMVRVWDYSKATAEGAEEGRRATMAAIGREAGKAASADVGAGAATHRSFTAGDGGDAGPALRLACAQLSRQARARAAGAAGAALGGLDAARALRSSASYDSCGAAVAVRVRRPPAQQAAAAAAPVAAADAAAGVPSASASVAAALRSASELVSIDMQLDAEPAAAGHKGAPAPALVGAISVGLGEAQVAAGFDVAKALHAGTHALALIRSPASAAAAACQLPEWPRRQLALAAAAEASCGARRLPPVAALLRSATGEQWLLCCDALATVSVGANLGRLWPKEPQGLRCYYSRGSLLAPVAAAREASAAAASAAAAAARPAGGAAAGANGQGSAGRAGIRHMQFLNTPLQPTLSGLAEAEAGAVTSGSTGLAGSGCAPRGSSASGCVSAEGLEAAAVRWSEQSSVPEWAAALLDSVAVPWAPTASAALWRAPPGAASRAAPRRGGRAVPHAAEGPDSGLGRAFLWWAWNQGSDGMARLLAPPEPLPGSPPEPPPGPLARAAAAAGAALRRLGRKTDAEPPAAKLRFRPAGAAIDGLFATAVEEAVLRREPLLAGYWRAYDALDAAGCRAALQKDRPLLQACGRAGVRRAGAVTALVTSCAATLENGGRGRQLSPGGTVPRDACGDVA